MLTLMYTDGSLNIPPNVPQPAPVYLLILGYHLPPTTAQYAGHTSNPYPPPPPLCCYTCMRMGSFPAGFWPGPNPCLPMPGGDCCCREHLPGTLSCNMMSCIQWPTAVVPAYTLATGHWLACTSTSCCEGVS